MQLLYLVIGLSFLATVSAFYGKVPGQQRMFEEYYKNDPPRDDYNWIPHFGMRENYKFVTTFKPDVSNLLYTLFQKSKDNLKIINHRGLAKKF